MGRREISYPVGGEDNSLAVQRQAPYTTPRSLNMRPFDVVDGRGRGGTRLALDRSHYTVLGSGNPIRLLNTINGISADNFDVFNDSFVGTAFAGNWSLGQFAAVPTISTVNSLPYASSAGTSERGLVASAATVTDFAAVNYRLEVFIVPNLGVHGGTYRLHARMDATSPVSTTDGVIAELTLAAGGAYSGSLKRYVSGVLTTNAFSGGTLSVDLPGWYTLEVTNSTTVRCYWRGNLLVTQTVAAATGNRFGFSLQGTAAASRCLVDRFRCQYFHTNKYELSRARPYASANGLLYRESWLTEFEQIYSTCTLSSSRRLFSAEFNNGLVIPDDGIIASGVDGTLGTTSFVSASIADWASAGVNKYDHSLQILRGSGIVAANFKIASISTNTITLVGGQNSSTADAVWRVVRNPKFYDAAMGDAIYAGTNGTTDAGGTAFDSASVSDWLVNSKLIAPTEFVRYKLEVISGTGATPGVYEITSVSSGSLTLGTSAGTSASNIVFRIFRDALSPIIATAGSVPLGCQVIARHMGRIYLADGVSWYACRVSDLTDWDYGASGDDEAAVASATAEIGVVSEPIVDLCPWHRDKMLFACRSSLWLLTGDPRGGALQHVSQTIGLAVRGGWCTGPNNELVFLSRDGIYMTKSDCLGCEPTSISRTKMPIELMDIGSLEADVCLKYDVRDQGVHIYITYKNSRNGVSHWWFDMASGGFWSMNIPKTMEPTSISYFPSADAEDDCVLLAGRDGIVRRFRDCAETDDGTAVVSNILLGPFRTADEPGRDGKLMSYQVSVPIESGDHVVSFQPGKSALEALTATSKLTITYHAGTSSIQWPKLRGAMVFIEHASSGRPLAFEFTIMETMQLNAIK